MTKELLGSLELNRIYQRDCLSDDGMALIPDKSIDMILCDLPYGTTAFKWDSIIPFEPLWEQYERIIKNNGAIVLFGNEPFSSNLRVSNIKLYKYDWTWKKNRVTLQIHAKNQPMRTIENIMVFAKNGKANYYPQMKERTEEELKRLSKGKEQKKTKPNQSYFTKFGTAPTREHNKYKYPSNFLEFKSVRKPTHPNEKPLDLFEYLIRTYTNEGDVILDNCMGSGTTAVASVRTGRKFIGFEREPEYIEIANKRLDNEMEESE